ncbi:unnamed protein product [Ixodes pacificus]
MTRPKLQIRAHKPKNKRARHNCFQRTSSVRVQASDKLYDRKEFVNPSENETRYRLSCNLVANTKAKEIVSDIKTGSSTVDALCATRQLSRSRYHLLLLYQGVA